MSQPNNLIVTPPRRTNYQAIFIIGVLFFAFGFITWLNSTLIPFLKLVCQLKNDIQAFFVTFAFYMAYFCLAIPSWFILKRSGYKNGMALGLFIMALGSLIFVPAANARSFPLFLTGLFVQGMGLALLQTASNPYISIIGPIESAARRISIMGICNKIAGMISPILLGAIILKNASVLEATVTAAKDVVQKQLLLQELASRIIKPYLIIAGILTLLAVMIKLAPLPEIDDDGGGSTDFAAEDKKQTSAAIGPKHQLTVFQFPHLLLGVLCIFLYVGVEVMAGDAIGMFGRAQGLPLDIARYFTFFTLLSMLIGYVAGIITITAIISQQKGLTISAIAGIIFSIGAYLTTGYVAIGFIALLGLANALMWPAIFPLAIKGLGRLTKIGSALLVMGIAGGAVIPLIYGLLKDKLHLPNNLSFFSCILPGYVYILYYSVKGYKETK
jgi:FHS family L-fucose permease-like MFS transporter